MATRPSRSAADRAFARYRAGGDPADLAEVFDGTAPRLILVAMHLVRDAADAEDLLQTTFLEAIRRAPSFEPGRPVLPWLLTILSRRAANRRRDESRRRGRGEPDPEVADRAPGPAARLEQKDALERVTSALEGLSRPYREVLVLRLVHGLRPIEIARALDRPPGTVHAWLHRGIGMLRRALPEGLAVPAALLFSEGVALAAVRGKLLAAARAAPSATLGLAAGGTVMKKLVAAVAAVLAITILGLWWSASMPPAAIVPAETADDLTAAVGADEARSAATGTTAAGGDGAGHVRAEVVGSVPAGGDTGSILVLVSDRGGRPLASVAVDVAARDGRDPLFATWRGASDARGRAWFRDLLADRYTCRVLGLDPHEVEVGAGHTTRIELVLEPGAAAEIEVLHTDGSPGAGAEVWLYQGVQYGDATVFPPAIESGRRVGHADAAGRCRVEGLHSTRARIESAGSHAFESRVPWLAARLAGHCPSPLVCIGACEEGEERRIVLRLGGPGCTVGGLVVDEQDLPVAGAAVELRPPLPEVRRLEGGWTLERYGATAVSDPDGRFVLDGLPAGTAAMQVVAPGHAPHEEGIALDPASSPAPVTIRLRAGAAVAGRVRAQDGVGVADARVTVARRRASTGAAGSFRIEGLAPGRYDYAVRAESFGASRGVVDCAAGTTERLDLVLEPLAVLRGVVTDGAGNALSGWNVWAESVDDDNEVRTATSGGPDGAFELQVLAGRDYRLSVREPETAGRVRFPSLGHVRGGGEPVVLAVEGERRATAFLTGYLLDPADRPAGPARFLVRVAGELWTPRAEHDVATGRFRIGPVLPGACELRIASGERAFPAFGVGPFALAPQETRDLGRLVPPPTGVLEVRIEGAGLDLDPAWLDVVAGEGAEESLLLQERVQGRRNLSLRVRAGSHRVRLWGDAVLPVERPVELPAGEEVEVVLAPQRGRRRAIVLALPEGEQRAEVEVRAAGGRLVYRQVLTAAEPTATREPVFGEGRHSVEAVGGSGRRYLAELVVDLEDIAQLRPELRPR